jgi:glycosyltransferase involved in cell wall biosynthesis
MLLLNLAPRRYDIVHAHTGHCGVLARLQRRVPIVLSYVGYDVYGKVLGDGSVTLKSRVEAAFFRRLAPHVDATVTKSAAMEQLLPGRARPRNTVLPNGVDRELFREVPRNEARAALAIDDRELTVLFAGRTDTARKRFALAEAACRLAAERLPLIRLRACEQLAHDHVPLWMSAADALVLPSLAEGSPNVVKEAHACNLPVVATDVGDVREVTEGVTRCRVLPRDVTVAELAGALVDVLRDAPARTDGRGKTIHLAAETIAERLIAVYESALRRRNSALDDATAH